MARAFVPWRWPKGTRLWGREWRFLGSKIPLSQSLYWRPSADQKARGLWVRDWGCERPCFSFVTRISRDWLTRKYCIIPNIIPVRTLISYSDLFTLRELFVLLRRQTSGYEIMLACVYFSRIVFGKAIWEPFIGGNFSCQILSSFTIKYKGKTLS